MLHTWNHPFQPSTHAHKHTYINLQFLCTLYNLVYFAVMELYLIFIILQLAKYYATYKTKINRNKWSYLFTETFDTEVIVGGIKYL